jgi:hypothetical protein
MLIPHEAETKELFQMSSRVIHEKLSVEEDPVKKMSYEVELKRRTLELEEAKKRPENQ